MHKLIFRCFIVFLGFWQTSQAQVNFTDKSFQFDSNNYSTNIAKEQAESVESEIHVPEAFTPNGDNTNETLIIFGTFDYYEIKIFNHFGEEIFTHASDYFREEFWDGSFDGTPVPNGVYYWRIKYRNLGEKMKVKEGTVSVIR